MADKSELVATIITSVLGGGAIVELFRRLLPSSDAELKHEEEFLKSLMERVDQLEEYALSSEKTYRQATMELRQECDARLSALRIDHELTVKYWKARTEDLEAEIRRLRSEQSKGERQ